MKLKLTDKDIKNNIKIIIMQHLPYYERDDRDSFVYLLNSNESQKIISSIANDIYNLVIKEIKL